ncbi:hypothetical protein RB195_001169 [Necator americanus]|uniref:Uncharacterized protein n=1 Tax=Necator americanus TaxID=51031 RepID=A0ABR1DD22_NECAM
MARFLKRYRGAHHQPKLDLVGLKNDECRKKFHQRASINIGLRNRKSVDDADSFTKCIHDAAKKTLPVSAPWKKFTLTSTKTISTYNSVCVARTSGDFAQEKGLRRKLLHQLKRGRENEWT